MTPPDWIAERTLYFDKDPQDKLVVRLGRPELCDDGGYRVTYQVATGGQTMDRLAFGADSIQAFQAALVILGGYIPFLERQRGRTLGTLQGEDAGFPEWTFDH